MKKSEVVLLWVAGLWAVLWLIGIASRDGRWSVGLAVILAGWVVCALVWLSINKWPKDAEGGGVAIKLRAVFRRVTARPPAVIILVLGYVLAVIFLLAWTNARAQINKERLAVGQIATGYFELSDCHGLPAPQAS
jgi:hypothetical protein